MTYQEILAAYKGPSKGITTVMVMPVSCLDLLLHGLLGYAVPSPIKIRPNAPILHSQKPPESVRKPAQKLPKLTQPINII